MLELPCTVTLIHISSSARTLSRVTHAGSALAVQVLASDRGLSRNLRIKSVNGETIFTASMNDPDHFDVLHTFYKQGKFSVVIRSATGSEHQILVSQVLDATDAQPGLSPFQKRMQVPCCPSQVLICLADSKRSTAYQHPHLSPPQERTRSLQSSLENETKVLYRLNPDGSLRPPRYATLHYPMIMMTSHHDQLTLCLVWQP